ncbi:MAG: RdgB/HAM1 family non-canonical purine NTP pyrophosphatase [Planctomycetaceae bacterium]
MNAATPRLVIASRNRKKLGEIAELLAPYQIAVQCVADFPDVPEVVEDGETFAANAAKKARETALHLSCWALGEDSGLMVDALGGAPGVYSARFAGEPCDDARNNAKLLAELANVPEEKRGAGYACFAAVSDPEGVIRLEVSGTCRGRILREAKGANGFGYDPYFLIPELHQTFGELSPAVKRHLSHRARAFERLLPQLVRVLQSSSG